MSRSPRILIVDDDRDFAAIYQEILGKLGAQVQVARSATEAVSILERDGSSLDVVLLDQKLQGPGGPDVGLDLIAKTIDLAPFAKPIVVTGYASAEAIERAFQLGVYDYLVKNGAFEALLRAKVRNAIEVTSERRLASASFSPQHLTAAWEAALASKDRNEKGRLLEELVKALFRATGFERVQTRLTTDTEEIDVTVENRPLDGPWRDDGAYLIGECKNWSGKCGPQEVRVLLDKMRTKLSRVRCGFLVAPGGFTDGSRAVLDQHRTDHLLVVLIGAEDLERWVRAPNAAARRDILSELYKRSVFSG